jgi:O-methyltransferase domain
MPVHGKLLVIELVLPPGGEPSFGKWLDLHMLVMLGARERTAEEYRILFDAAGFELARVIPTKAGPAIVEAVTRGARGA